MYVSAVTRKIDEWCLLWQCLDDGLYVCGEGVENVVFSSVGNVNSNTAVVQMVMFA